MNQSDSSLAVVCSLDMEKSSNSSSNTNHLLPIAWHELPRIVIHSATHFVCEVFDRDSRLLANATTGGSFSRHGNLPPVSPDVLLTLHASAPATCELMYALDACPCV